MIQSDTLLHSDTIDYRDYVYGIGNINFAKRSHGYQLQHTDTGIYRHQTAINVFNKMAVIDTRLERTLKLCGLGWSTIITVVAHSILPQHHQPLPTVKARKQTMTFLHCTNAIAVHILTHCNLATESSMAHGPEQPPPL